MQLGEVCTKEIDMHWYVRQSKVSFPNQTNFSNHNKNCLPHWRTSLKDGINRRRRRWYIIGMEQCCGSVTIPYEHPHHQAHPPLNADGISNKNVESTSAASWCECNCDPQPSYQRVPRNCAPLPNMYTLSGICTSPPIENYFLKNRSAVFVL